MVTTDPVQAELRSAIRIKKALDRIRKLPQLGYCPTKAQQFHKKHSQLDTHDFSFRGAKKRFSKRGFRSRDLTNQVCKHAKKPDSGLWSPPKVYLVFYRLA